MQYTDRLGLRKPEQHDHYNVDDFNYNYQKISESFAGVPTQTDYMTIDEFIASEQVKDIKKGDAIVVNSIIYIFVGDDPLNKNDYVPYGADGMVIMREYVPISERVKGSMYLQLGKTRRLVVKIFKKFFGKTKNLLPYPFYETTKTQNGVAFTDIGDGTIVASGTSSGQSAFTFNHRIDNTMMLGAGEYKVSGCPSGGSNTTYRLVVAKSSATGSFEVITRDYGDGATFTLTEDTDIYVGFEVLNGATVSNLVVRPMVRLASITDDTYEPYKKVEADNTTLLFQKTNTKTTNISDGSKYRFTCMNLSILQNGDTSERLQEKLYFVIK